MAMHIHSSFSEQQGSMDTQLCQAAQSLVDVLWWTDHDQRMTGLGYRDTVHFTSLDAEQPDPGQGKAWHWTPAHSGRLADWLSYLAQTAIPAVHQAGGLASYNHPFGSRLDSVAKGTPLPPAQQDALLAKMAMALLPANGVPAALGSDLLEVGYPVRAGVDLAHHLALWDAISRNALFLTGNGTSDNHTASPWPQDVNNWATSVWADSTGTADLLAALAAGRAWCGSLSEFATSSGASLDLTVDGTCPMGSVSLSSLLSRQLTMTATGIPPGGRVTLWQGDVDYAGTSGLQSNAGAVGTYPRHRITAARGSLTVPVDTTAESYARLTVADAKGTTVAASNPVWMLQNTPPGGIPAPRHA